ncbi:hypothetical protein JXO59_00250 [candidate division KSB1 bacterium]|nr:hypothetical protein [candidate division KSB1 bacterium]
MRKKTTSLIICFLLFFGQFVYAQGLSRNTGVGVRASFWSMSDHVMSYNVSGNRQSADIDLSGVGVWLFLFSRVHNHWFLTFESGAVGSVSGRGDAELQAGLAEGSAVTPILFGMRYDFLSSRMPGALQPYVSGGIGPYWINQFKAEARGDEEEVTGQSALKYGVYAGAGTHIILTSWFALNFDLKYHFVDFHAGHDYSGIEFGLGLAVMWGKKREIFQIREIELVVQEIYPVDYQFYNSYPLALVKIKNVAGYPIEINVRSNIKGYSERPKDSGFIKLEKNELRSIPVTAIFSPAILSADRRQPAVLDLAIEARPGTSVIKQVHAQLFVHHRQAWNGDMKKLKYYITPEEKQVIEQSKQIIQEANVDFSDHFNTARVLFEYFAGLGLAYRNDPDVPFYQDDRVQSALETLKVGSGDCDDLVVLYASFLQSLGIRTASVEVRDPQKDQAHLYLLFDSGLEPEQGELISSNEKKYIIRQGPGTRSSIWIPIETTRLAQGFHEAWNAAALAYQEEGIIRNGLAEGWVTIIDNQ